MKLLENSIHSDGLESGTKISLRSRANRNQPRLETLTDTLLLKAKVTINVYVHLKTMFF